MNWTRRDLLKAAMAVSAGPWLASYRAWAAPFERAVKITAIKALQLENTGDGCLIRVETDAGVMGYGDAGCTAQMARARIAQMGPRGVLMGQDPLAIERMFYLMTAPQNALVPQVGLISGIDMALWDIAGKVIGQPVHRLLGGPMRPAVPIYSHGSIKDMTDEAQVRDWWGKTKDNPEGFKIFKFGMSVGERGPGNAWSPTADGYDLRKVGKSYEILRKVVGSDIDIAMHATGQFDLPTAIGLAKACEPSDPAWFEDPMNYIYSENWVYLKRSTRVPILTGEKLELVAGFKPYLDNGTVNVIHPDPSYAGGITGIRKIADYAAVTRVPVALHSGKGSLVRYYAALALGGTIQNFFRIENVLGPMRDFREKMAMPGKEPMVRNSETVLPTGPGLGLEIHEDWVKKNAVKDEPYWA